MPRQYVSPGGALVNATGTRQYVGPDGELMNENTTGEGGGGGGATIELVAGSTSFALSSGSGNVSVQAPDPGAINLVASGTSFSLSSSSGVVTVTPAGLGTLITEAFYNWSNVLLVGLTVNNVLVLGMDRSVILSLADQVTGGDGRLVISHSSIVPGTEYMIASFSTDGIDRGLKKYLAS